MPNLFDSLLFQPLLNALIGLFRLTGDLGWSIILLTILLRLALTPLVIPSLRLSKKMQELAPELAKLKEQYKDDKTGLITAQTQLYKQHGANPASGCLPQVLQLFVLFALYKALNSILMAKDIVAAVNPFLYSFNKLTESTAISTQFGYLNLIKPDVFHLPGLPFPLPGLFLVLAALVQLISSKMMSPAIKAEKKVAAKTEESFDDTMVQAQEQMLYMFPLMTLLVGFNFASGLVIYWFVFSAMSALQQYFVSGWGGLSPWLRRLHLLK